MLRVSVVSFNSTKRRPVFYCLLRRLQNYHWVQLNALFCCLWRNVEAFCHKHFVVFSRNQHRRLLPAMCHKFLCSLVLTQFTNVTDTQTDIQTDTPQTPHDGVPLMHSIARQKSQFSTNLRFISEMMQDRAIVTMEGE